MLRPQSDVDLNPASVFNFLGVELGASLEF